MLSVQNYRKVYVSVMLRVSPDGAILPLAVTFEDGKTYIVDRIKFCTKAHATKVGGTGLRYTIVIQGKETYLFEENGLWFVEAKGIKREVAAS